MGTAPAQRNVPNPDRNTDERSRSLKCSCTLRAVLRTGPNLPLSIPAPPGGSAPRAPGGGAAGSCLTATQVQCHAGNPGRNAAAHSAAPSPQRLGVRVPCAVGAKARPRHPANASPSSGQNVHLSVPNEPRRTISSLLGSSSASSRDPRWKPSGPAGLLEINLQLLPDLFLYKKPYLKHEQFILPDTFSCPFSIKRIEPVNHRLRFNDRGTRTGRDVWRSASPSPLPAPTVTTCHWH